MGNYMSSVRREVSERGDASQCKSCDCVPTPAAGRPGKHPVVDRDTMNIAPTLTIAHLQRVAEM